MCRRWSLCWPVAGRDPGRAHDEQFLSTRKVTLAVSALKSGQSVSPGTRARPAHRRPRLAPSAFPVCASGGSFRKDSRDRAPLCLSALLGWLAPALCHGLLGPCPHPCDPAPVAPRARTAVRRRDVAVVRDAAPPVFVASARRRPGVGLLCASAARGRRLAALALTRGGDVGVSQLGMPSPRELGCWMPRIFN